MDGYVLVIGSAGFDIKGRSFESVAWGQSNLGHVRNSVGGVGRNIAENLSRLEVPTILLSAVSADSQGTRVITKCEEAGIDCQYVLRIPDGRTGNYMALLRDNGELQVAISDFEIMNTLTPDYLLQHEGLFADAEMVVIDSTLSEETLETLFEITERNNIKVCADPTTPSLAGRLCKYIDALYLIIPNTTETQALCDVELAKDRESGMKAARSLVAMGAEIAVVTMGEMGVAYAHPHGTGFIRAIKTDVIDSTGAGDAFSGAVIFGLLNDVPLDEAMRLGVTAASLTLGSRETVLPHLNQELLYDELMA